MENFFLIIPVYNEDRYIGKFLRELVKIAVNLPQIKQIIIVDDGSTDKTKLLIKNYELKINKKLKDKIVTISHKKNLGKGAAMTTGMKFALKRNSDCIIFMDGDGQHDPKYLPKFVSSLRRHSLVFGYRILGPEAPYIRKLGNVIARFVFRHFFHIARKDLLCGFMAMHRTIYKSITWHSRGYGVEAEISALTGRKKLPFHEIKINTVYHEKYKGVTLWDAFIILLKIPFWYFGALI